MKTAQNPHFVYIATNKRKTVLYTNCTDDLDSQMDLHRKQIIMNVRTFTSKYKVCYLLFYQRCIDAREAERRKTEIKGWRRSKKMELIYSMNPELEFLEIPTKEESHPI
ncbi:GIY-YIG nuclease family protein [Flavobacterium agri]|uniref:GIY-YIG nuclease family protein n=1 Tax=Flavobacterium agri TaxID=2743471 RepID=UPI003527A674